MVVARRGLVERRASGRRRVPGLHGANGQVPLRCSLQAAATRLARCPDNDIVSDDHAVIITTAGSFVIVD